MFDKRINRDTEEVAVSLMEMTKIVQKYLMVVNSL